MDFAGTWPTATSTGFDGIGGSWSYLDTGRPARSRVWTYALLGAITFAVVVGFFLFLMVNAAGASGAASCGGG